MTDALKLPDLPYPHNALEPVIDAKTMEIHHGKHHNGYVTNANKAMEGTNLVGKNPVEILEDLGNVPENIRAAVRNNVGGHVNHSLFWTIMAAPGNGGGGAPTGELATAINESFGSFDAFTEQFSKAAATRFGSGWAWLCVDGNGALMVTSTPNQDSPYSDGHTPILGLDVWEHAYYLHYQNRRPDYIAAFFNLIDWNAVGERYAKAKG